MERGHILRKLPKVDVVAARPELAAFTDRVRAESARKAVDRLRGLAGQGTEPSLETAVSLALQEAQLASMPVPQRVVNMTGVVCHTGLGRARLAREAAEAARSASEDAVALEFDLESGSRGDRQDLVRGLLQELTGAEDALVVNNAAGAVFLTLAALASGREVILSRGQMVEIGGSFRLPDIVRQSNCHLVEVGCTNRTRLSDYEAAWSEDTAAILRCHPSNYAIVGFTSEVGARDLAELAHQRSGLMIDDQGSGLLLDTALYGMPRQPRVQDSIAAGADVTVCSGDKLLGGPQAGLVLGTREAVGKVAEHPLARALRADKMCLAALAATLRMYRDGRELEIPTWRFLRRPLSEVREWAEELASAWGDGATIEDGTTEAGSGAAPGTGVRTWRVGLETDSPDQLLAELRGRRVPVIGRIEGGKVWLDPRTAEEPEIRLVEEALRELRR